MQKNARFSRIAQKIQTLDDTICDFFRHRLTTPVVRLGRGLFFLFSFLGGMLCTALLTPHGLATCLLFGVLMLLWIAPLLYKKSFRVTDLFFALLALLFMLCTRLAVLDFVSVDSHTYLFSWAETMSTLSFGQVMRGTIGDYNVVYQYFVFLFSRLALPVDVLYKVLSFAFEPLLAYALAMLVCQGRKEPRNGMCFLGVYLITFAIPTLYLNSAFWSQCDSIYAALALYGLACANEDRPARAAIAMTLGFCFKLQAIFLFPILALLLFWRRLSLRHIVLMGVTFVVVHLPALLCGKTLGDILGIYFYQAGEYTRLVLHAPSLLQLIDGQTLISDAHATMLGIALAAALVCLIFGLAMRSKKGSASLCINVSLALCVCIPFLLPHMHERYFYMADMLCVVWALIHPRRAFAPLIMLAASINGYALYLFKSLWFDWTLLMLPMILLCGCTLLFTAKNAASLRTLEQSQAHPD